MDNLQDRFAPSSVCFGCGPANKNGLQVKSKVEGEQVVANWRPDPHHHAFKGVLNGGIIGTILDCHSNWAAAYSLMKRMKTTTIPATVTAEFCVKLLKPTPMREIVILRARVVDLKDDRATVESSLEAEGNVTATFRGTFVAVKKGHPAFARWK